MVTVRARLPAQQNKAQQHFRDSPPRMASPPKKLRLSAAPPRPEELDEGTHVLYDGHHHGVVRDAYIPLDEFWVTDFGTGQLVRDKSGEVVQFKAAQLRLAPTRVVPRPPEGVDRSAVLLIGREQHMVEAIENFGAPDEKQRRHPQQLLAIPCQLGGDVSSVCASAVPEELVALAQSFRPDIHVGVRALQIQQAIDKIGTDLLRLEGYYLLCSVQLPYSQDATDDAGLSDWERHQRRNISNQVDICPTVSKEHASEDSSEAAARTALGYFCGIEISDALWESEVQLGIRRSLGVELATSFQDSTATTVTVVLLPENAVVSTTDNFLCFSEAPGVDYAAGGPLPKAASTMQPSKTVKQWERDQAKEFTDLPKLPAGWLHVKSRSDGEVYYFNTTTQESTFDQPEKPLGAGWTKQVSKTTGKVYYFNTFTQKSTFDRPATA